MARCPLCRWGLSGTLDGGAQPGAVLQAHLDLAPDEEVETHFVLGQAATRDEALALVARYRQPEVIDAALDALHVFWDGVLGAIRVATPDPAYSSTHPTLPWVVKSSSTFKITSLADTHGFSRPVSTTRTTRGMVR